MAGNPPSAADPDNADSVRMTWNAWPRSKIEASKCVIPIAASISPLRPSPDLPLLPYPPLRCKPPCSAVLNPFCRIDFPSKIWICPFCFSRNHFPPHYSAISETNFPGELYPESTTVEYCPPPLAATATPPPVFLFVIDTCLIEEELEFVRSGMRRAIGLLPESGLVGVIAFGTQVHLYELGFSDLSKLWVFRGTREISKEVVLEQLGLAGRAQGQGFGKGGVLQGNGSVDRFLLPASDCEYTLNAVSLGI